MVGLILVSNSPVLALAADDVSQPENQTPAVEIVENTIPEVVEVTEEPVVEVIVEVVEEVATSTDETILEVVVEEATSTEPVLIDEPVELEVTLEVVEAARVMTMTAGNDTEANDNSFAISEEQGATPTSEPTNNSTPGEGQFTTNPNDCSTACGGSGEDSFTTPGNNCPSTCGGNTSTSTEHQFTTLPMGGCTSDCGGDDEHERPRDDVVLGQGAVPLDVRDQMVKDLIATKKQ